MEFKRKLSKITFICDYYLKIDCISNFIYKRYLDHGVTPRSEEMCVESSIDCDTSCSGGGLDIAQSQKDACASVGPKGYRS